MGKKRSRKLPDGRPHGEAREAADAIKAKKQMNAHDADVELADEEMAVEVIEAPREGGNGIEATPRLRGARPALTSFEALVDYERRSLAHVAGVPEQIEAPGLWRGIGFRVGDRYFVSNISEVNEILSMPAALTPVPATRNWLLGVGNVRGNLIAVVDLKQFLTEQRTHVSDRSRVLWVKQAGGGVGLLVDEVLGQRNLTDEQRVDAEGESDARLARFVTENVTLGERRWGMFSVVELTRASDFQQASF
ncbi:MAG TPA: chemotaxis protein CheW [Rhodanobacteraceae bacterium]|nr:chemotaxis protein CheW [Rhodanobacteraceae bacterium]